MNAKILIILPTSNFLHRQILEGILDYARENGPGQFPLSTGADFELGLQATSRWGVSGYIALVREPEQMKYLLRRKLPGVLINPPVAATRKVPPRTVFVNRDQEGVGRTAAEYFLERGYTSFAFVGSAKPAPWSERRLNGFRQRVSEDGHKTYVYDPPSEEELEDFSKEAQRLKKWLTALPAQTAVFCARDRRAQQVLGICLDAGIAVPESLSVLGSDDDALLCEAMTPALSSISLDGVQSGRLCARLLDDLLHGRAVNPTIDLAFPRVVTRQSTDASAIKDTVLARALKDVRDNLAAPISIDEMAAKLGFSKRTLELKAQKILGCTFRDEINRIRLNEAVRLISNTDLSMQEIALRCGFCCASHLGTRFKRAFGYSPSTFRYSAPK